MRVDYHVRRACSSSTTVSGLKAYLEHPAHDNWAPSSPSAFEEALMYDFELQKTPSTAGASTFALLPGFLFSPRLLRLVTQPTERRRFLRRALRHAAWNGTAGDERWHADRSLAADRDCPGAVRAADAALNGAV